MKKILSLIFAVIFFVTSAYAADIIQCKEVNVQQILGGRGYKIESKITDIEEGKSVVLTGYTYNRGNPFSLPQKSDAEIYYTLDGSSPEDGTLYEGEIILDAPGEYALRATTRETDGFAEVEEFSEMITVEEKETEDNNDMQDHIFKLTLNSQMSGNEAIVVINVEPEAATLYYTIDGEEPTEESEVYTEPILLYEDTLIKAVAMYDGSKSEIVDFNVAFDEEDYGEDRVECPYCGENVKESDILYDEHGGYCPCCNEYIFDYDEEYNEEEEVISGDLIASDWAIEEIEEAYKNYLIPEYLIGKDLTDRVNRGEFAAIAVQLYEELSGEAAKSGKTPFDDIIYADNSLAIEKAYALDIVNGISKNTFEPYMDITREQLATMLCRTIKKYSFDNWTLENDDDYYLDAGGVIKFADDDKIFDYAKPSVYYMVKLGVIKGMDKVNFAPKNTATREQAIMMALRLFKKLGGY